MDLFAAGLLTFARRCDSSASDTQSALGWVISIHPFMRRPALGPKGLPIPSEMSAVARSSVSFRMRHPEGLPLQHETAHCAGFALHQRKTRRPCKGVRHRGKARIGFVQRPDLLFPRRVFAHVTLLPGSSPGGLDALVEEKRLRGEEGCFQRATCRGRPSAPAEPFKGRRRRAVC